MKTIRIIFLLSVVLLCSCKKEDPLFKGLDKVDYASTDEIFPNPERGFYSPVYVHGATPRPISQAALDSNRKMGYTLFLLEFHLTEFVNTDISDDYLQLISRDFELLRSSGAKCILRFAYSDGFDESDKPWDATEEWVLRHIAQLKPLLQEYYDVIMVLQAGFIGSWGEWYYTENFGARSKEDYAARKRVVDALLDALPECRQVALRIPTYKMKMYGYSAADTLTRAEAHKTTPKARLGGHNDCYLADANDTGTFTGGRIRLHHNGWRNLRHVGLRPLREERRLFRRPRCGHRHGDLSLYIRQYSISPDRYTVVEEGRLLRRVAAPSWIPLFPYIRRLYRKAFGWIPDAGRDENPQRGLCSRSEPARRGTGAYGWKAGP